MTKPSQDPSPAGSDAHDHSGHDHPHDHAHEHGHDHGHGHSHAHGHAHGHVHGVADERRLAWAFAIIFLFMLVEIVGGIASGSLALLADAGHMVSDAAALALGWAALRVGRRPADDALSYGYKRVEVLAAFINGCTLIAISAWIIIEAVRRFATPITIEGPLMLGVASAGLVANLVVLAVLTGGNRGNLNMRAAWLHVFGDMLGSIGAIGAAVVIIYTGFTPIDPILSIGVALLILKGAASIVRSSARILLEGAPEGFELETVRHDLIDSVPGLADIHHLHAWSLGAEQTLVTLHATPLVGADPLGLPGAIAARLAKRFRIDHVTVQVETGPCVDAITAQHLAAAGAKPPAADLWRCL